MGMDFIIILNTQIPNHPKISLFNWNIYSKFGKQISEEIYTDQLHKISVNSVISLNNFIIDKNI